MNSVISEIDDNISIQKIIWMNLFRKHRYIFHISKISITLFLSIQLFLGEVNRSTKYNQRKKKSLIYRIKSN